MGLSQLDEMVLSRSVGSPNKNINCDFLPRLWSCSIIAMKLCMVCFTLLISCDARQYFLPGPVWLATMKTVKVVTVLKI